MMKKLSTFSELNPTQLKAFDQAIDAFIFREADKFLKGEPYAPSFRNNPKQFRKFINALVSFKQDVMRNFKRQYQERYKLIKYGVVADEDSEYFYNEYWNDEDTQLAQIIEEHTHKTYNLGIISIAAGILIADHHSTSPKAQKFLTKNALEAAGDINSTTKERIKAAIKASLQLQEDRAEFDQRLEKIFVAPYRGMLIAQQEGLESYMQGKHDLATEAGLGFKTWVGPQAQDHICGDTNGETVKYDSEFSNGLSIPPAHFGCRCDVSYSDKE